MAPIFADSRVVIEFCLELVVVANCLSLRLPKGWDDGWGRVQRYFEKTDSFGVFWQAERLTTRHAGREVRAWIRAAGPRIDRQSVDLTEEEMGGGGNPWVTAIYKRKSVFQPVNYRGVHLTAQASKVMERALVLL